MAAIQKKYTIPLRKDFQEAAPLKRGTKAMRALKEYLRRHCKVDEVKIGAHLNEEMWARGIRHPPARVTVNVVVDGGVAKAELEGFTYVEAKKIEKKQEPASFKEKLAEKLGKKDEPATEKKVAAPAAKKSEDAAASE